MATNKFNKVKAFFDDGLWGVRRVHDAVDKGWITAEQYAEIIGEEYEEE